MRKGLLLRQVVSASVVTVIQSFAQPAVAAEPDWWLLETPRFKVLSTASEKSTRVWSEEFNQFLDELGQVIKINEGALPELTVIMFPNEREFTPYKPLRPDGEVDKNVAGVFNMDGSYSSIALSTLHASAITRRVIYHESVHWHASVIKETLPIWFEEGLAEVFSTFRMKGGKVRWGESIEDNLYLLEESNRLDLEELLSVSREDSLFSDERKAALFYAESWLFVHYSIFGVHEGSRRGLTDYLIKSQMLPRDAAFEEGFGMNFQAMEKVLNRYRRGGKYFYHESLKTSSVLNATYSAAPPELVHAKLALLAYANGREEQLNAQADALADLEPDSVLNFEVQALRAHHQGAADRMTAAVERAIELGTADARLYLLLADEFARQNSREPGIDTPLAVLPAEIARRVVNLCQHAIEIFPMYLKAYKIMAWALLNVEKVTETDARLIRLGLQAYPDVPDIKFGLAVVERHDGNLDQALQMIRDLELPLGSSYDAMRGLARIVDDAWMMEEYQPKINIAIDSHQFEEADRLFDELDTYDFEPQYKSMLRQQRQLAAVYEQLYAAEVAIQEKRRADARAILKKIKSLEGPYQMLKRRADRLVEYYKLNEPDTSQ